MGEGAKFAQSHADDCLESEEMFASDEEIKQENEKFAECTSNHMSFSKGCRSVLEVKSLLTTPLFVSFLGSMFLLRNEPVIENLSFETDVILLWYTLGRLRLDNPWRRACPSSGVSSPLFISPRATDSGSSRDPKRDIVECRQLRGLTGWVST